MTRASPWWHPDRHADRKPFLIARSRIKEAIRSWFLEQGFVEIEPGCLQVSPGNETHLEAFETELRAPDRSARRLYLHTSPEFALKKLLAAGERRVFSFVPVFRNGERGALHAPEFTMLEWYRAEAPYELVMDDCQTLLALAAAAADNRFVSWRGQTCNPRAAAERLTVAEAFSRYSGIDLRACAEVRDRLAAEAERAGISVASDDDWSDIFSKLLTAFIEPRLGIGQSTLLTEYPITEAALSRPVPHDPAVAERFELYVAGVELANGFGELIDAAEQRRRFIHSMDKKQVRYGVRYPIDEDFIAALEKMPPSSGCALGFDRLVMLMTGATHINQVIWTPMAE